MMKPLTRFSLLAASMCVPTLAWSQDILVLGANDTGDAGADANVIAFLEAEFGNVRYMNSSATDGSETADVIVMSSTFGSGSVRGKFHNSPVPVVNWEEAVMDAGDGEFGQSLVGMTKSTDTLMMALGDHPIAGDLAGTTIDYISASAETLGAAQLSLGTVAVGTGVGGAVDGLAMLFVTETGAAVADTAGIADNVSPARRVALPMTDATFDSLTDAGKQLFVNAIRWAAGGGSPAPIVDLDASTLPEGPISSWANAGTLGDTFTAAGDPEVKLIDQVKAVQLDGDGDWLVGPIAPDSVTGANPRTVDAWIHNFTVDPEESVFSWGRRGGPEGSNVAFTHGSHPTFGAVGHWGAPDIGWNGQEEPDIWTHIAYTQDGSETSVYVNGVLANSETIAVNTHTVADDGTTPLPFVVGNQNEPNGTQSNALLGSLSIAKLRVYAEALSPEGILANYRQAAASFGRDDYETGVDGDGDGINDELEMKFFGNLAQTGDGDLDGDGLTNADEAAAGTSFLSADSDGDGVSDGDEIAGGSDPTDPVSVPATALSVLVNLDASGLDDGTIGSWANAGTLGGTFDASGDPMVESIDGVKGVTLDGTGDWLVGPTSIPSIEGGSARSIEAWVYNPEIAGEETVVSWGRRGGPEGSNVSFNHGGHPEFGAVGHWGAPDIGWNDTEEAAIWSHIVYSQDGNTTRVYTNGVLASSEDGITLNTHSGQGIVVGAQWDNETAVNEGLSGSLSVSLVRVYDGALSDDEVTTVYNERAESFGRTPVFGPPIVELDSRGFPGVGPLSGWTNTGSLGGNFTAEGDPQIEDIDSVRAITLDGTGDWLVGPIAPDSVTGAFPRTVEAWVKNPTIDDEETVFAWGRRGGPEGSNVSFNHGAHPTFGAVGHWGAPDIGWNGDQEADIWTHVAYTQDGSETRVYTNGLLSDSEAVTLNTHTLADDGLTPLPFVVGNQNEPNGTQVDALSGSMSIAVIRVYDRALGELEVATNYNADAAGFGRPSFFPGADDDNDGLADDYELATFGNLDQTGDGDLDEDGLTNAEEAGAGTNPMLADSDNDGASDKVEIDAGTDPLSPASVPAMPIDLLVELQAASLDDGAIATWANSGTLVGDFTASGDPMVETVDGAKGVTLDGNGDWFVGPIADPTIEGASGRSITAWIYNPEAGVEETVVSWGRRGGPAGTNMSFNHGTHNAFGAVGHWGNGPDIGWDPSTNSDDADTGLGEEETGIWTHIAYTQDGSTTRVYTNGALTKADEGITLNTHSGFPILLGSQWEGDGVTPNEGLSGSMSIGSLRIYNGSLSDAEIAAEFNDAAATYGRVAGLKAAPTLTASPLPEILLTSRLTSEDSTELTWPGLEGAAYEIEFSTTLQSDDWAVVGTTKAGEDGSINFIHDPNQASQGYYRVRLIQSLD